MSILLLAMRFEGLCISIQIRIIIRRDRGVVFFGRSRRLGLLGLWRKRNHRLAFRRLLVFLRRFVLWLLLLLLRRTHHTRRGRAGEGLFFWRRRSRDLALLLSRGGGSSRWRLLSFLVVLSLLVGGDGLGLEGLTRLVLRKSSSSFYLIRKKKGDIRVDLELLYTNLFITQFTRK